MKKALLFLLTTAIGFAQINVTSADYVQQGKLTSIADAGANDTYTGCPTVAIRAYATGMTLAFKPNTVNTGAASLNVCSLGAKSIKTVAGADPSDGTLAAGKWYLLTYDGTNFQITGGGGSGGASLSGTTNDVLIFDGTNGVTRQLTEFVNNGTTLLHDSTYIAGPSDDVNWVGKHYFPASSTQNITAVGNTITANRATVAIDPDANYTLTSAPTIADGTNGQTLRICNLDTAFTVTLQDQDTLASSNLQLNSSTVGIAPKACLGLYFNGTDWIQEGVAGGSSPSSAISYRWIAPTINSTNSATGAPSGVYTAAGWAQQASALGTTHPYWQITDEAANAYIIVSGAYGAGISNLDVKIKYNANGAIFNGNLAFRAGVACKSDGASISSTTFSTPAYSTFTPAANTSNLIRTASVTNVLSGAGCVADDVYLLKIEKGLVGDGDTNTTNIQIIGVVVEETR